MHKNRFRVILLAAQNLPQIDMSDKVVITGYSGSGKTTLLRHIVNTCGLAPMYVVDTVNYFSRVPSYNYAGVTKCNEPRKGKLCLKLHTEEQFESLMWYLNHKKSQFFMVVDEIDRYCNPMHLQREVKLYLEEGRNFNRGGIFTVRRIGFLNKSILGNAHYLYLFKSNNVRDLQYLTQITGINLMQLNYSTEHAFHVIDLHRSADLGEFSLKL